MTTTPNLKDLMQNQFTYVITGNANDGYTIKRTGGINLEFDGASYELLVVLDDDVEVDKDSLPHGWGLRTVSDDLRKHFFPAAHQLIVLSIRESVRDELVWWQIGSLCILLPPLPRTKGVPHAAVGPYITYADHR